MEFSRVEASMSFEEAVRIRALMDRDASRPVIRIAGSSTSAKCPNCQEILLEGYKFCSRCGQRVDMMNEEI